jgi:hypothetical protein
MTEQFANSRPDALQQRRIAPVRFEHDLASAKETLSRMDVAVRRFAAREPMMAALGALGVGFLLGRLFSSR